jgi:hypothetical protein
LQFEFAEKINDNCFGLFAEISISAPFLVSMLKKQAIRPGGMRAAKSILGEISTPVWHACKWLIAIR